MEIRTLTSADAEAYQPLRLASLREHPEAFGSAYEDEAALSPEAVAERLRPLPDRRLFGAWVAGDLAGILSFARSPGRKTRHRAGLGAMYVAPVYRGQGIGRALLAAVIDYARTQPDLEELILAVTVGNEPARRLYVAAGFEPAWIEQRYIKVDDRYYDIEWLSLRLASQ
jgi:RimJ/RimL family protein N-acetyltransferase